MGGTHDYDTTFVLARDLDSTHVLVGESGGLSAVYNNAGASSVMMGFVVIETEHGTLYLDPEEECEVIK